MEGPHGQAPGDARSAADCRAIQTVLSRASMQVVAGFDVAASVWVVRVEFVVGAVGKPVRIVAAGAVLPERYFERAGVEITEDDVDDRLFEGILIKEAVVMKIVVFVVNHLAD